MTTIEIQDIIINEFDNKTLGVTEQYLEILKPVYKDGKPEIYRVDERETGVTAVFLPVEDEYFFLVVYIDSLSNEIFSIGTEPRVSISMIAISESLTAFELISLTTIAPTLHWNKGELKPKQPTMYNNSGIEFKHVTQYDTFENQIKSFLTLLHTDKKGITELVKNSQAYIQVILDFHYGNQLFGYAALGQQCIKMLAELNLSIAYDLAAWGDSFK